MALNGYSFDEKGDAKLLKNSIRESLFYAFGIVFLEIFRRKKFREKFWRHQELEVNI